MISFTLEAKTEKELKEKIEDYLDRYHPAGYGTSFKQPVYNSNLDLWIVAGWRSSSCD